MFSAIRASALKHEGLQELPVEAASASTKLRLVMARPLFRCRSDPEGPQRSVLRVRCTPGKLSDSLRRGSRRPVPKERRQCSPIRPVFLGLLFHQNRTPRARVWSATAAPPDAHRRRTRGADRLSANRCLDPTTPSAMPATPLTQTTMLVHLASTLAVWALDVGRMQAVCANRVLEVELAHVGMDDVETLIAQQCAKRKT
jgi:hypothetical protein